MIENKKVFKKNNTDSNFLEVISILQTNKINYWLGHGTLLGIIRDNNLIEWDHDIDIAVWATEVSQEKILKIMKKENYILREGYGVKTPDLSFNKKGGRIVDFNFYEISKTEKDEEIAQILWPVPKNYLMKLIHALSEAGDYNGKFKLIINSLSLFKFFFKYLKNFCIKKGLFYKMQGYSEPVRFIEKIKKMHFNGLTINVPSQPEEYLKHLYGNDWRVPKKKFVWYKDGASVVSN